MSRTLRPCGITLITCLLAARIPCAAQSIFDDPSINRPAKPATTVPSSPASPSTNAPPAVEPPAPPKLSPRPSTPAALPDAASIKAADARLRQALKDEAATATTPALKSALARRTVRTALAETAAPPDPADQYAGLVAASAWAIDAADFVTADAIDDEIAARFFVDRADLKLATWDAAAKRLIDRAAIAKTAVALAAWVDARDFTDHPTQAVRLLDLALRLATKSANESLLTTAAARLHAARDLESAYNRCAPHLATLAKNPADPAANFAVGRYYALTVGNWAKALPMFARSADPKFRDLAKRELDPATTAPECLPIADGWYAAAASEHAVARELTLLHAADVYRRALPTAAGLQKLKAEKRIAEVEALTLSAPAASALARAKEAAASGPGRIRPGKLLLSCFKEELAVAEDACRKLKLPYDVAANFDADKDYAADYNTIVVGSNRMDYWGERPERKEPEAFRHVDAFLRGGGHLVVFGSFNARNCEHLKPYGIVTSFYHGDFFDTVPGASDLLFQGNEALVPDDHRLHTAGNFKCTAPHTVLLQRLKKETDAPDGPLMVTLPVDRGRLTFSTVEPGWKQPRDGLWLVTCTLTWIAHGSPTP